MWKSFWEQVRGNFKYDIARYLVLGGGASLFTLLVVFARKLAHRPPNALEWWLVPVVGVVAMVVLAFFLSRNQRLMKVSLQATSGPNHQVLLNVHNLGMDGRFTAFGEITGHPNGVNDYKKGQFRLNWRNHHTNSKKINRHDMEQIIIGTFEKSDHIESLKEAIVWETVENRREKHSSFRWHSNKDELLPSFNLRVTIVAEGTREPLSKDFKFGLCSHNGPLELIPSLEEFV
jgi:hypothetical protein